MKNLRYLLIGVVLGGGFGAKLGGYLATYWNLDSSHKWIESGFIYGSLTGLVVAGTIVASIAIASSGSVMRNTSKKSVVSSAT